MKDAILYTQYAVLAVVALDVVRYLLALAGILVRRGVFWGIASNNFYIIPLFATISLVNLLLLQLSLA